MAEASGLRKLRAVFWILTGSAIVVFLIVRGAVTYRTMRAEGQTIAVVVETEDHERSDDDSRQFGIVTAAVYEFEVNGKRFSGLTEGEQGSWSEGDTLTVEFNPENPAENRAAGDRRPLGDYFVMLVFGGVFGVAMIRHGYSTLRGRSAT
jgi:hypothetical protein